MAENESNIQKVVLDEIMQGLQNNDAVIRIESIQRLETISYSSEAIRILLEKLAVGDKDLKVRKEALAALNLQTHRYVQSRVNKLPRGDRNFLLKEIKNLENDGLVDEERAEVIRRRYDFDIAPPPPAPKPALEQPKAPEPVQKPAPAKPTLAAPVQEIKKEEAIPPKPAVPAGPRPTLLQTLLSETSIKIALYLGAFFVIASAIILSTLGEVARLLVLITGTIIFGGVAVAIRKRLPQPSFALFIVFSFLLPITASVIEDSLHLGLSSSATYWVSVFMIMALIWSGSTWLYESRLFSITAFVSFTLALYRIGDIFKSPIEFYTLMVSIAAFAGLVSVQILKKWKEAKFALPLFGAAQLLQVAVLMTSISIFFLKLFDETTHPWNMASAAVWVLAFIFFAFSDILYSFSLFPWIASATLIPIPWFISTAFNLDNFANAIFFAIWGILIATTSEVVSKSESTRKYSLPVLLTSIPSLTLATFNGFAFSNALGDAIALLTSVVYGVLHYLRTRGWLWAIALLSFVIAYFGFFTLPSIQKANIFFGYELLGLSLIFLVSDLFLKSDFKDNLAWRLPPRIYGAGFTFLSFVIYAFAQEKPLINTAILFVVFAIFFALYSAKYKEPLIGYIATLALPISLLYGLNHFDLNLWLEAMTLLSVVYYASNFIFRNDEARKLWRPMFVNSALILGSTISFIAFVNTKPHSGGYIAVIGVLFLIEMYVGKKSLHELGAHLLFPIALFLILRDFKQNDNIYLLFAFSMVWLALDLLFFMTYKEQRILKLPVQILGAATVLLTSIFLLIELDPTKGAICFSIYTIFFAVYALLRRNANYAYAFTAYLSLAIFFLLRYFKLDLWLPALTGMAVLYFALGFVLRTKEDWALMFRNSGLILASLVSLGALLAFKETGGWYVAVTGILFIIEMYYEKEGLFELGPHVFFPAALYLILRDFKLDEAAYILMGFSLIWLGLDLIFSRTFKAKRVLENIVRGAGALAALVCTVGLLLGPNILRASISFGIFALFFTIYTLLKRKAIYGYIPAAYLPLTIYYTLLYIKLDLWLPILIGLVILYFLSGYMIRAKDEWSLMLRNSALVLGTIISLGVLILLKETGGWYTLIIGVLFAIEMYLRKDGRFEAGLPIMFNIGGFLILHDLRIDELSYHLLVYSLAWLLTDLLAHLTFTNPRMLKWPIRSIGAILATVNYGVLFLNGTSSDPHSAVIGFGVYTLLFLIISLLYRQPLLGYAFTTSLPLFIIFLFREFHITKWIHPVIVIAVLYYAVGYFFRQSKRAAGWDQTLLFSGLGLGVIVSIAASILGGVDAAIPVAAAATLWAIEAYARKNAWLAFPANGLYLLAYFILLFELKVNEPQFFSMGAALLGMIQHYLLSRTGSKLGAFIMGTLSQFVLLGTTYIQMVNTQQLIYLFVLFPQAIVVIFYGAFIRSRSLTFVPIGLVVLASITVLYSQLKGISTVLLIGCSGIVLLMLGILAVLMRERITKLGEQLTNWEA